ncbi:MAG: MG2 domain-containing protein [Myxococcales bacterium]
MKPAAPESRLQKMNTATMEEAVMRRPFVALLFAALLLVPSAALAQSSDAEKEKAAKDPEYVPADQGQRPTSPRVLPDDFLRGYDPVTVYFAGDEGPGRGPADDGAKLLKISPSWPGAWTWIDRKTLQYRPAEPWPALARFAIDAKGGTKKVLTTMMSAPSAMSPSSGSDNLKPFRSFTLTFPQALPVASLKQMLKLEVRELPGLADSKRLPIKSFSINQLPRASQRDPAVYAITLEEDVPEGKQLSVSVSLALGDEGKVLWSGKLNTRLPFHLESFACGSGRQPMGGVGAVPRDMALFCGTGGEKPQMVFSATVADMNLTTLKKLVALEPSVPDLRFETFGNRVQLHGKFLPDVLYKARLAAAPVHDDSGRLLRDPGSAEVYFYLGWKSPFLRWSQATAVLEANGPRMLPLTGYGDPRADVRVYRVDPMFNGLWPFPSSPVVVSEQEAPPMPGEEPEQQKEPGDPGTAQLVKHLRLLGSPLVSKLVDLPLAKKSGTTRFGLDLAPLIDPVVGKSKPGTYLVGLRRLTGTPQRTYMRVQVTNLSLTSVDEQSKEVFYVRSLDKAEPVKGAKIVIEVEVQKTDAKGNFTYPVEQVTLTTDQAGRATLGAQEKWRNIRRVSVQSGEDLLVIDPREPPPQFASNHWSLSSNWLQWLSQKIPPLPNEKTLAFVFTERAIYKPGEPVFIKGYVRRKEGGELKAPLAAENYVLQVSGPDDAVYKFPVRFTALGGFDAKFEEKDIATGTYTVSLLTAKEGNVLSTRTFKIEAYRIPTFEVQLASALAVRLDAPFKVKAVGRYYAGGFLAGQPISWKVTRSPYHYVPRGRDGFLFADSTQFARPGAPRPPDVLSKTGTLDEGGADSMEVNPALDIDGSPRLYKFEATVTGPDDQQITSTQDVKALPPFLMGMKLQRYSDKPFELKPEIIAVGVDDKLLAGQEITVRLHKRVWHSVLREAPFATGQAKYVTEQEDTKLLEKTIKTEADKAVMPSLPITESGVFVVELFARDKLGRVQTLSADLYVGGAAPMAWPKSREGVFELATDKKKYVPGDTAKIVIQSPFQTGKALVIVEEPGFNNSYTWLEVVGGKAVHEVKLGIQHVPNLPVHVVLMRGRLGEGSSDDSRYRPQTLAASTDLEVEPTKNSINVGVAHPEQARPGQKVDFTLTLADDKNQPLSGEVTFWLVDEAVLSLAKEATLDPLKSFIDKNQRTTAIRDTRNLVLGKLVEQDEEPGGDGGDEEGTGGGKRIVRKEFKTVPFYQATVQIPASGKLVLPVKLSDDLTNFRVRAVAASGLSRFGHKQSTIRVRLPLLVQPQLPRFVRAGDKFYAGGVVRLLEGAEGAATVDMSLVGPVEQKGTTKNPATLKMNAAQSVLFPVTVNQSFAGGPLDGLGVQELKVTVGVTRNADGAGDAFEVKLPVLPDRTMQRYAYFDRWKEGKVAFKPLPETARPGTVWQDVLVTSEPGILELASGLQYLDGYPHGCLEQKMSKIFPHLAYVETFKKLGLEDRAAGELPHVKRLLEEMPSYQDPQGFFAYWPGGGAGDVALTAQALEFMVAAKKAGAPVDAKLQERAIDALKRVLRSDFRGLYADYRYNQQSAAVRALVRAGSVDENYLIDLYQHRADMDVTSLADLVLAMDYNRTLFKTNLAALDTDLWDSVVIKQYKGKPIFDGLRWRRSGWGYGYLGSNTSAIASVLEGLVMLDPTDKRLELLRDGLIASSTAYRGFGSTHDNRRAVAALTTYLEKANTRASKVHVALEGDGELMLEGTKKVARTSLQNDTPKSATVEGAEVGARVVYHYLPLAPGVEEGALKEGFLVQRSMTVYKPNASTSDHFDDQKGANRKLSVGDVVEIHARMTSDEERYHVALVVPFAAGLEPLNPELETSGSEAKPAESDSIGPTYVQRLDHEVRYYFTRLPAGTHSFHFRVRAVNQGSFVHPSPWAEMMYRQEVRGRGEGMRVTVEK